MMLLYSASHSWLLLDMFNTQNKAYHKQMRHIMSPSFGISYIKGLEPFMYKVMDDLCAYLDKAIEHGGGSGVVNIWKTYHSFGLDVIGFVLFGLSWRS